MTNEKYRRFASSDEFVDHSALLKSVEQNELANAFQSLEYLISCCLEKLSRIEERIEKIEDSISDMNL